MRTWSRLRIGAALLGAGALLAASPVIPDPVLVEPADDVADHLAIVPGVHRVELQAGGALVIHHVENGRDEGVELTLAAERVTAADDGAPVATGEPADGWRLPASRVALDPGERARVTSVASGPGVVRLTATPAGGTPLVAYVVVTESVPTELTTTSRLAGDGVEVELVSVAAPSLAEVRLRAAPPVGPALVDETTGPVVLLANTPRRLTWRLDLPAAPWPVRVEVDVLVDGVSVATSETRVWPAPGPWLAAAGALVVLGALWLLVRSRRHTHA